LTPINENLIRSHDCIADHEKMTSLADMEFLAKVRLPGSTLSMFFPESDTSFNIEGLNRESLILSASSTKINQVAMHGIGLLRLGNG
jgi:hypothetical protein